MKRTHKYPDKLSFIQLIRNRKTFFNILVSFILLSLGILLTSIFFLYNQFSKSAVMEIGGHTQSLLQEQADQYADQMNDLLGYMQNTAYRVELLTYALSTEQSVYQEYQTWRILKEIHNNNSLIASIAILNDYTDRIVDSRYGLFHREDYLDQGLLTLLSEEQAFRGQSLHIRRLDIEYNSLQLDNDYFTFVYYFSGLKSALIMNLDIHTLQAFFERDTSPINSLLYMVDNEQRIVASPNRDEFLTKLEYSPQIDDPHGWYLSEDTMTVYAAFSFFTASDWRLVQQLPLDTVLHNMRKIRTVTYWFFSIVFFISLFMIWLISKRIYRPIRSLLSEAVVGHENHSLMDTGPDLDILSKVLSNQKQQIKKFQTSMIHSTRQAKQVFLRDFLHRPAPYQAETTINFFKEFAITLPTQDLTLIILRIDEFSSFTETYSDPDRNLIRYAMVNITGELLQTYVGTEVIDMKTDHIVVICDRGNDTIEQLRTVTERIQIKIVQLLKVTTTAAISQPIEHMLAISASYMFTLEHTNERFKFGGGRCWIQQFVEEASISSVDYRYPEERERQLINELNLGHQKQFEANLNKFIVALMPYSYSEIRLSLLKLLMNLTRALQQLNADLDLVAFGSMSRMEQTLNELENKERFKAWLTQKFEPVFQLRHSSAESNSNAQLIQQIQYIVQKSLSNPNLSTKLVAEQLKYSATYIRQLFKDDCGLSLADYITDLRLEEVKRQLQDSSQSIEDIVKETGFSAVNSFYTIFKRKLGITPSQYRRHFEAKD